MNRPFRSRLYPTCYSATAATCPVAAVARSPALVSVRPDELPCGATPLPKDLDGGLVRAKPAVLDQGGLEMRTSDIPSDDRAHASSQAMARLYGSLEHATGDTMQIVPVIDLKGALVVHARRGTPVPDGGHRDPDHGGVVGGPCAFEGDGDRSTNAVVSRPVTQRLEPAARKCTKAFQDPLRHAPLPLAGNCGA